MTSKTLNRCSPELGKHRDEHGPLLLGVERGDWRAQPEAALELGRKLAGRGQVAYWVVSPEGPVTAESKHGNRRAQARERTRLRSAKLLDGAYRFVCEGRICDRSRNGLRLALAQDVPLPLQLAVHIDETSEVREAKVVWRCGATVGIRLHSAAPANALKASQRYSLRKRYYAIPD